MPQTTAHVPARLLALGFLLASCLLLTACGETSDSHATVGGGATPGDPAAVVLAHVNGRAVTQGDVDTFLLERSPGATPASLPQLRKQFGDSAEGFVIEKTLVEEAIEKAGIQVSPAEIQARWDEIRKVMAPGTTIAQFLSQRGTSREKADEQLRFILAQEKLIEQRGDKPAAPTDAQIQAYYAGNQNRFGHPEQIHARHILLKVDASTTEEQKAEKRKLLETLRKELLSGKGATFEQMAASHSEGPTAPKGGDLGWFGRGRMVPAFEKAAFALKPGELSDIVQTQYGYHLIRMEERRPAEIKPLEDVKDSIRFDLQNAARRTAYRKLVADLKATAKIQYTDPK
jgi:peptidyl-prolyl cis-trans isomerase C